MSEYLDRESEEAAEIVGSQLYMKHLHAMTKEGLHAKSSIALELARRDFDNKLLNDKVAELEGKASKLSNIVDYIKGRIKQSNDYIGVEVLAGNEVKQMVESAAKAELEGVLSFLRDQ